jgi:hypothetical protein
VGSSGLSNQLLEAHLTATIQESLSLFLFDNAKWLGERLVAHSASEVEGCRNAAVFGIHPRQVTILTTSDAALQANITLLAGCYFQSNQAYRAYHLLRSASRSQALSSCSLTSRCSWLQGCTVCRPPLNGFLQAG